MYLLALVSAITLLTVSQVLQKMAANRAKNSTVFYQSLVRQPVMWVALGCLASGTLAWLLALSHYEVSRVFPLLSLTFVFTTVLSVILLDEQISIRHFTGIVLVTLGVSMVGLA